MTDKDKPKPVTLADYIPPEPAPQAKRSTVSKRDRERLDALDRDVREEKPTRKKRPKKKVRNKKSNTKGTIIFWIIVIILLVNIFG